MRSSLERLLHEAHRSGLLRLGPAGGRFRAMGCAEVVCGLRSLAMRHREWMRPLEAWEPAGVNTLPLFASLARHLLAAYPVPAFMTSVWFKGRGEEARRQQGWFVHIGAGRNIRTADLPLAYTKMMAHHFLRAPHHFTVEAALRWGQVRGLGGSRSLAVAVAGTWLGQSFRHEDFWRTVVQFFVNRPGLDLAHVSPIVDYLHHQRFISQQVFIEGGDAVDLGPPQPNLSMKGRTPSSLLRQIAEWRRHSGRPQRVASLAWKPTGIGTFRHVERDDPEGFRCWTIRELTSSTDLFLEGQAMGHCVASYAGACARRERSIWSMEFQNGQRRFRVMTIEVDPATRTIGDARRRYNAPPNEKALRVMRLWAAREGLHLGTFRELELAAR